MSKRTCPDLRSPVQPGSERISGGDDSQHGVRLAAGRDDQRANRRGGHENHVEADVIEREDPAPVGVVDVRLHQRVNADLHPLRREAKEEGGDKQRRLGVKATGEGLRDCRAGQQDDYPRLR